MIDVDATIISQYANSPTLVQLIESMNGYIDQNANFAEFYDFVWNVETAQGFGLDIWGRIVDVSRYLEVDDAGPWFGFDTGAVDSEPFDEAPFKPDAAGTNIYRLSDAAYRQLILVKALANICETTSPALNQLLQSLFAGRGRAYVNDLGNMAMRYVFEFTLLPYERAIIKNSGVLPHPAGVSVQFFPAEMPLFGFSEAGVSAFPFDEGAFFTPE